MGCYFETFYHLNNVPIKTSTMEIRNPIMNSMGLKCLLYRQEYVRLCDCACMVLVSIEWKRDFSLVSLAFYCCARERVEEMEK